MRYCGYCGMPMEDGDLFCTRCGKGVSPEPGQEGAAAAGAVFSDHAADGEPASENSISHPDPVFDDRDASAASHFADPAFIHDSEASQETFQSVPVYYADERDAEPEENNETTVRGEEKWKLSDEVPEYGDEEGSFLGLFNASKVSIAAAAAAVAVILIVVIALFAFRPSEGASNRKDSQAFDGSSGQDGTGDDLLASGSGDKETGEGEIEDIYSSEEDQDSNNSEGEGSYSALEQDEVSGDKGTAADDDLSDENGREKKEQDQSLQDGQKENENLTAEAEQKEEEEKQNREKEQKKKQEEEQRKKQEEEQRKKQEEEQQKRQDLSDGYILAGSDTRYLSRREIEALDSWSLQMAINELYARHGRIFETAEIRAYFLGKSWYQELVDPATFSANEDHYFNEYEKANLRLMTQVRTEREQASSKAEPSR